MAEEQSYTIPWDTIEQRLARQFGEYVRARRKTLGYPKMISPP